MSSGYNDPDKLRDALALAQSFKSGGNKAALKENKSPFTGSTKAQPLRSRDSSRVSSRASYPPAPPVRLGGPPPMTERNYQDARSFIMNKKAVKSGQSILKGAGMAFLQRQDQARKPEATETLSKPLQPLPPSSKATMSSVTGIKRAANPLPPTSITAGTFSTGSQNRETEAKNDVSQAAKKQATEAQRQREIVDMVFQFTPGLCKKPPLPTAQRAGSDLMDIDTPGVSFVEASAADPVPAQQQASSCGTSPRCEDQRHGSAPGPGSVYQQGFAVPAAPPAHPAQKSLPGLGASKFATQSSQTPVPTQPISMQIPKSIGKQGLRPLALSFRPERSDGHGMEGNASISQPQTARTPGTSGLGQSQGASATQIVGAAAPPDNREPPAERSLGLTVPDTTTARSTGDRPHREKKGLAHSRWAS